jgi:hypothetical protein
MDVPVGEVGVVVCVEMALSFRVWLYKRISSKVSDAVSL